MASFFAGNGKKNFIDLVEVRSLCEKYRARLDRCSLMNVTSGTVRCQFIKPTETTIDMSFNKIILVGNLGRDPELRYTPQGDAVCDFSMATNDRKRDKSGEYQDVPTWFRVTLWGKQAENASKYLAKGKQVYIEGRLSLDEWTDRDGNTRQTLQVTGTDMRFIGTRGDAATDGPRSDEPEFAGPASSPSPASSSGAATAVSAKDDDIPF